MLYFNVKFYVVPGGQNCSIYLVGVIDKKEVFISQADLTCGDDL